MQPELLPWMFGLAIIVGVIGLLVSIGRVIGSGGSLGDWLRISLFPQEEAFYHRRKAEAERDRLRTENERRQREYEQEKQARDNKRRLEEADRRPCPFCAESIKKAAKICRYCNNKIPKDNSIAESN